MSNVQLFQPGIAFKRFKLRTQIATEEYKNSSLYYLPQFKTYETLAEFKQSLTYDERGFVFDYYYYPVRIKRISEYVYMLSVGKFQHFSTVYSYGYRNKFGKWIAGWKGNNFGMTHDYTLSSSSLSEAAIVLERFIAQLTRSFAAKHNVLVSKQKKSK